MSGNPFDIKVDALFQESDMLQKIMKAMSEIVQHEALIGIPEESNAPHADPDAGQSPVSNAELLYIHTYGSPANGIPPRDVLESSMKHNKENIALQMEKVLRQATQGNLDEALKELEHAGVFAEGKAKAWFTDPANGWKENSKITVNGGWIKKAVKSSK